MKDHMYYSPSRLIVLDTVDSTNNYAAKLLRLSKPVEWTVIMARHQVAGRGQRGSFWESEPGVNLLCSVILYPGFIEQSGAHLLSMAAATALARTADLLGAPDISVKWPNDVFSGTKKLAGILIELGWVEGHVREAVVGVGLNVNQVHFTVPEATSLQRLTGRAMDPLLCLENWLNVFGEMVADLETNGPGNLSAEYLSRLYQMNKLARYRIRGNEVSATILGLTNSGLLELRSESGENMICDVKEITYL